MNVAAEGKLFPSFRELVQISLTFVLVMIGWIIFRAESISEGSEYLLRIFQFNLDGDFLSTLPFSKISFLTTIFFIILLVSVEWVQRTKEHALYLVALKSTSLRWGIYIFLLFMILLFPGKQETFIYFQF